MALIHFEDYTTGLRPHPRGWDPRVLGPRPLHQAGGGPSPGGDHLARRAHQVLRHPSSLINDN